MKLNGVMQVPRDCITPCVFNCMEKKLLRFVLDGLFFDRQHRFFAGLAIKHLHRKGDDLGKEPRTVHTSKGL